MLKFLVSVFPQFSTVRADVSRVTPNPHHGVTHGSNI